MYADLTSATVQVRSQQLAREAVTRRLVALARCCQPQHLRRALRRAITALRSSGNRTGQPCCT